MNPINTIAHNKFEIITNLMKRSMRPFMELFCVKVRFV